MTIINDGTTVMMTMTKTLRLVMMMTILLVFSIISRVSLRLLESSRPGLNMMIVMMMTLVMTMRKRRMVMMTILLIFSIISRVSLRLLESTGLEQEVAGSSSEFLYSSSTLLKGQKKTRYLIISHAGSIPSRDIWVLL